MEPEEGNADEVGNTEKASGSGAESGPTDVSSPAPAERRTDPEKISAELTEARFAHLSRRELLKVAPVLVLGAFAVPGVQEWLLKKGLGFSDWASRQLFRRGHLAPTFEDSELTPF